MLDKFAGFFFHLLIYISRFSIRNKYFRKTTGVLYSLCSDQARRFVGTALGPNRLQRLSANDRIRLKQAMNKMTIDHKVRSAHQNKSANGEIWK